MPRIIPEPRYFSIPSTVVGAAALRHEALNWTPCVRSLIQFPQVAKDGDQIAMTTRLCPQCAEPVLFIVEGETLYRANQDLGRRPCAG